MFRHRVVIFWIPVVKSDVADEAFDAIRVAGVEETRPGHLFPRAKGLVGVGPGFVEGAEPAFLEYHRAVTSGH